jgi:pimeloyl-ACP methyl ester carboxylesterase
MAHLRLDGIDVGYETTGGGEPAVCLVHGTGGTGGVWARQLEGLADVARLVAPDLPGHGRSGGEVPRSIAESSAFVARFLDALALPRVVIGGHSMGGAIALQFALSHPERVTGLALVGTGARLRVLPRLLDLLATAYHEGVDLLMGMALAASAPADLRASLHRQTAATPQRVVLGDLQACDAFDALDRVASIAAPTVAICGEEDQLTPPRYARFLGERIKDARVVVVPGAGHYVQVEQPDATTAALRDLVTAVATARVG